MDISDEEYYRLDEEEYFLWCIERNPGISRDGLKECLKIRFKMTAYRAEYLVTELIRFYKRHHKIIEIRDDCFMIENLNSLWVTYEDRILNKR